MCARPEPDQYIRPIADLAEEFRTWETPLLPQLAWAGVTVYRGLLENA